MTYELRDYQEQAVKAVKKELTSSSQALVEMASGLGKTAVAAALSRDLIVERGYQHGLLLVHETGLLRQAKHEFRNTIGSGFSFGIFNGKVKEVGGNVLFATFQSMREGKQNFPQDYFDFIVVDEAHHTWAETFKQVIDYFDYQSLFGMTATPMRGDGKDIKEIFGSPVYCLPLEDGIRTSWLVPFEYHLVTDDFTQGRLNAMLEKIEREPQKVNISDLNHTLFVKKRDQEIVDIIRDYQGTDKKTIIFTQTIAHCKHIAELMPEAEAYHSHLRPEANYKNLDRFRNGSLSTLIVVDKFNEGIDIPDAEMVVFLRRTQSERIFLQQLGRGLRTAEGKTKVVVLDFVANLQRLRYVKNLAERFEHFSDFMERAKQEEIEAREKIYIGGEEYEFVFEERSIQLFRVLETIGRRFSFYDSYEEAKQAVKEIEKEHRVEINRHRDYLKYYKEDPQLPSRPQRIYSDRWESWTKFLDRLYSNFQDAKRAVKELEEKHEITINSSVNYQRHHKKDSKLPSSPNSYYSDQWQGWKDFLKAPKTYDTLQEAEQAIRRLEKEHNIKIDTYSRYKKHYRKDSRLPSHPNEYYSEEWKEWKEFLGTKLYSTLGEARQAVRELEKEHNIVINSGPKYRRHYKKDRRLPSNPNIYYSDQWQGWKKFLGTELYPDLEQAKQALKELEEEHNIMIDSRDKYKEHYKKDRRLHSNPNNYYAEEWKGWDDFLRSEFYNSLEKAKQAVKELEEKHGITIKSQKDYYQHYNKDRRLPSSPNTCYPEQWQGWRKFLRTERYETLERVWQAVKELEEKHDIIIDSGPKYRRHYKKDRRLPGAPDEHYSDQWQGWKKFLRTKPYNALKEAKKAVKELEENYDIVIRTQKDYYEHYNKDRRLTSNPNNYYAEEWKGWDNFLSKERD